MNYLDLFHGIGGFALGAYWAGMKFENHYCSDIEPWCQKLYAQRFPDSIQLGDITKINAQDLPAGEWIISGGFPCQDISIAGKGAGIHGDRSGLWFEYWRLINDLRPRFAIMENVGMLVHRGLREVLGSLAEIGYDAEWQDIRASDVGAPHRRERIWIVAYPGGTRSWSESGQIGTDTRRGTRRDESTLRPAYWENGADRINATGGIETIPHSSLQLSHGSGPDGDNVAHPSIPRLQGQEPARGRPGESGLSAERGDEFSDAQGERLQGRFKTRHGINQKRSGLLPSGQDQQNGGHYWSTEPDVGRLAHGIPNRVDRLKGLGNAIVPQIAEILFRQIKTMV